MAKKQKLNMKKSTKPVPKKLQPGKKPAKPGRPTIFTQELGDKICAAIADNKSLRRICEAKNMPCKATVFNWLRDDAHQTFVDQYTRACEERGHSMAEETLEIADAKVNGSVGVQRNRLRVETRKWLCAKLHPKVYSEKFSAEHFGPGGGPIPVAFIPPDYEKMRADARAKYGTPSGKPGA
jgi:hypothetical protein